MPKLLITEEAYDALESIAIGGSMVTPKVMKRGRCEIDLDSGVAIALIQARQDGETLDDCIIRMVRTFRE